MDEARFFPPLLVELGFEVTRRWGDKRARLIQLRVLEDPLLRIPRNDWRC